MAFGRTQHDPTESEINITSLIDILFIILIFLVLTTSFSTRTGVELRLPESSQQREAAPPKSLRVELTTEGTIYLEGRQVSIEDLRTALVAESDKQLPIVLRADQDARHGKVVEVLDAVRGAGFRRLAVEARSKAEK